MPRSPCAERRFPAFVARRTPRRPAMRGVAARSRTVAVTPRRYGAPGASPVESPQSGRRPVPVAARPVALSERAVVALAVAVWVAASHPRPVPVAAGAATVGLALVLRRPWVLVVG